MVGGYTWWIKIISSFLTGHHYKTVGTVVVERICRGPDSVHWIWIEELYVETQHKVTVDRTSIECMDIRDLSTKEKSTEITIRVQQIISIIL